MIRIGTTQAQGNGNVIIPPPAGFDTVHAVRLTNYTTKPIVLTNISSVEQTQEILPPLTAMVYKSPNTSDFPRMTGVAVGAVAAATPAAIAAGVFVEWASDPVNDFLGVYPYSVAVVPA